MALEKARGGFQVILDPLAKRLEGVNPSTLTWISLVVALASMACIMLAGRDTTGGSLLLGGLVLLALAALLDGLDGKLARATGKVSRWGDYLDHTIDRIVDIGIIVAIALNPVWNPDPWLGWSAAVLTLLGSYLGTQAQSVGLTRNYGGFGRADRLVVTLVGLLLAAIQAFVGWDDPVWGWAGTVGWNGLSVVLAVSALGGVWTFLRRFVDARSQLLAWDVAEPLPQPARAGDEEA